VTKKLYKLNNIKVLTEAFVLQSNQQGTAELCWRV